MKQLIKDEWLSFKSKILIGVFSVSTMSTGAQNTPVNLVPNGSFEGRNDCPIYGSSLHECLEWDDIYGSVDHFHTCGSLGGG